MASGNKYGENKDQPLSFQGATELLKEMDERHQAALAAEKPADIPKPMTKVVGRASTPEDRINELMTEIARLDALIAKQSVDYLALIDQKDEIANELAAAQITIVSLATHLAITASEGTRPFRKRL